MKAFQLILLFVAAAVASFFGFLKIWPEISSDHDGPIRVIGLRGDSFNLSWRIADEHFAAGRSLRLVAKMRAKAPEKFALQIYDGTNATGSQRHPGDGKWHELTVVHTPTTPSDLVYFRVVQAAKFDRPDLVEIKDVEIEYNFSVKPLNLGLLLGPAPSGQLPANWVFDGGSAEILPGAD